MKQFLKICILVTSFHFFHYRNITLCPALITDMCELTPWLCMQSPLLLMMLYSKYTIHIYLVITWLQTHEMSKSSICNAVIIWPYFSISVDDRSLCYSFLTITQSWWMVHRQAKHFLSVILLHWIVGFWWQAENEDVPKGSNKSNQIIYNYTCMTVNYVKKKSQNVAGRGWDTFNVKFWVFWNYICTHMCLTRYIYRQ